MKYFPESTFKMAAYCATMAVLAMLAFQMAEPNNQTHELGAAKSKAKPKGGSSQLHGSRTGKDSTLRPQPVEKTSASLWHQIDTSDFPAYIGNLRKIGCPEQTIRDIITAELREEFQHRRKALLSQEPLPYWDAGYGTHEDLLPDFARLGAQEHELASKLLGVDAARSLKPATVDESVGIRLGAGLAHKEAAVEQLFERMSVAADALIEQPHSTTALEDKNQRFHEIHQEFEAALKLALSPAEYEAYNLRHAPSALAVRDSLRDANLQVSEREFQELYQARRQFEELSLQTAHQGSDLGSAWDAYLASSSRILGEARSVMFHAPK